MMIVIKLAYNGANYCGWQVQSNGRSIQGELNRAGRQVFGEDIKVTGCSRTDSGVHAREYFCTFEVSENAPSIPLDRLPSALNRYLDPDITVFSAMEAEDGFHARYSVKSKRYEYVFDNGEQRDPFLTGLSWHVKGVLDEKAMDEAAKGFIGRYDFSAFMASGSSVTDTVRNVFDASVRREGTCVIFSVSADGFLYNMVRIMAGTLYEVSIGKIARDGIKDIILSLDRARAGVTAPPSGLYLAKVNY